MWYFIEDRPRRPQDLAIFLSEQEHIGYEVLFGLHRLYKRTNQRFSLPMRSVFAAILIVKLDQNAISVLTHEL